MRRPTMKQSVSDLNLSKTHTSPTRHHYRSAKIVRRRKNSGGTLSPVKLDPYDMIIHESSNSPYYQGLTDQSLAILDAPPPHTPTTYFLSSAHSPYYKGLTDYSLAIGPPIHAPPHPINSLSSHESSSPYYSGLIDYSLALHGPSPPPINSAFCIRFTAPSSPPNELMVDADDGFLIEQKPNPLRDKENAEEEMEMEIEEKPLRERVSEEACDAQEEKTILEMDQGKEEEVKDNGESSASEQTQVACREGGNHGQQQELAEEGKVVEYVWATKYQPMTLEDFICNRDKALHLKQLVKEGCGCDNFIFEGPPSAGKRCMIRAMLREVFGADRVQIIEECKEFKLKGEMVDKVRIKKSLHHVEVNLSETKGYEKHVIIELFKETYSNNSLPCSPENCQAIILYEAEKLSLESLLYIKWLLEKYKGCCSKVFFCCSDESRLQPVKSICTTVRLSSPSSDEIVKILEYIGKEEGIKLSRDIVEKIILRSKNNLRQAIRSLEATCRNKDTLNDDDLILTGWEDDVLNIAKNIIEEQSPRQLYVIRRKLQSLMIHDVPPDFIYKSLVAELTILVDDSLRPGVAKLDKEYNRASEIKFETVKQFGHAQNKQGGSDEKNNEPTKTNGLNYSKIEEFIAKFMSWYKNSSEKDSHVQLVAGT